MPRARLRLLLAASLAVAASAGLVLAESPDRPAAGTLVLLVRHAEKGADPPGDPSLSTAGEGRARALAAALRDAGVTAVITSQFRRTRETAQPVATARGVTPEVVAVGREGISDHVKAVASAVRRHPGEVVLVVGHSNTIPSIVAELGGPRLPDLCDSSYGHLFVLRLGEEGARLVRTRYGAADPEPGPGCE